MSEILFNEDPDHATLTLHDVSVRLGGREVLHDVNFEVGEGEFVGLIGSNGAGKTTLLRVILGLQRVSAGDVRICGHVHGVRRNLVGYVPQKISLDPDVPLRSRDVVALGLDGHKLGMGWPSRRRRRIVDEALRSVGAEQFAEKRVGTLSGGEQQRVLIAHALVGNPRLLLLDEPLANLDLKGSQEISALLSRLARERQITVILSAHDINPLLNFLNRVIYLADGRAASGTVDEVVQQSVLSALYKHHVDVLRVHDRIVVIAETVADVAGDNVEDSVVHVHRNIGGQA
jgi:zinc/manganese transport system ATP-binding protein